MLTHLRQHIAATLTPVRSATLVTSGPAGLQANVLPCLASGIRLYLLLPRTSDHLLNLEHDPEVVVTTEGWQVRGRARLLSSAEQPAAPALLEAPDAPWSMVVEVQPARVTVAHREGWALPRRSIWTSKQISEALMIVYRTLHPAEEQQALDLWTATIPAPREQLVLPYWSDPQRLAHTRVAVSDTGAIIAAAHYCLRQIRDAKGTLQLVGGVAGLATDPAYRRQGHARRLMEQTIEAMREEGCRWSLLFTTANGFYVQLGWRTFTTRYREGRLGDHIQARPTPYVVRRFAPQHEKDGWALLGRIYAVYNQQRPLTMCRDASYWRTFAGVRFSHPQAQVSVAVERATEQVCGYMLAYLDTKTVAVIEAGVLDGHDRALEALLRALRSAALSQGIELGRVYLPVEGAVDAAVAAHFQTVIPGSYQILMGRPLAADYTIEAIEAAFSAPGAISWPVDDF